MKWIPVKDRLPEVSKMVYEGSKWMQPIGFADYFLLSDWVLVTADADSSDGDDTEIFVAQYEDDLDGRTYWTTIGAGLLNNVTAWMPLPQPYKADRKTEPNSSEKPNNSTISKMEQVDEPKTQMKTQNSNLTFEKRTMRDCYNCERYETEGECIECHFEPKDEPQTDCGDFADRLAYERGVKHAWEVAQKVFDSTVTFYEAEDVAKQIDKLQTERSE